MFNVLNPGRSVPIQRNLDPNAEFSAGMLGQLKFVGNSIVLGISDGIAPLGIIDDTREVAYLRPVIDEIVTYTPHPDWVDWTNPTIPKLKYAVQAHLQHANIAEYTYASNKPDIMLIPTNGDIIFPAGMALDVIMNPAGTEFDSVSAIVRYSYYVPNMPGLDTTAGSSKVTIWVNPAGLIGATDQYESNVPYPLNCALYCSPKGRFTSEQTSANQPSIAMCLVPPTASNAALEFVWL